MRRAASPPATGTVDEITRPLLRLPHRFPRHDRLRDRHPAVAVLRAVDGWLGGGGGTDSRIVLVHADGGDAGARTVVRPLWTAAGDRAEPRGKCALDGHLRDRGRARVAA